MVSEEPPTADVSERREALVAERERALAKRAGELAVRERALKALERHLHERVESLAAREAGLQEAENAPPPELEPEPEPNGARSFEVVEGSNKEAEPLPASQAELYSDIELDELERLVRSNRDEHPDLAESWEFTLYHLREYADVNGRLPLLFDGMIDEVFGTLLDR